MVDVEREGPVARIFLNRPEKANALDSAALEELRGTLRELAGDPSLRTVVLGGRGRTFCGGADLRVAAEGTRFAMPEVRLGIPSVVEAALLPRLIGTRRRLRPPSRRPSQVSRGFTNRVSCQLVV